MILAALAFAASAPIANEPATCAVELVVLGAGQDAGAPQIGVVGDNGPRLLPSALGLIDRDEGKRYLFDATPAITQQLAIMDAIEPASDGLGIDGVFLTHAHIGHYLGLAYFGREAAGASNIPVYVLPRMEKFLRTNGPWSQLVELGNIELTRLYDIEAYPLRANLGVSMLPVPHRDEYSETTGFIISDRQKSALYLPDIDSWAEWEARSGDTLEELIGGVDYAFVNATFWDDNELLDKNGQGRDMSEIPHPRVTETMDLLQHLSQAERAKVHFIHYNHTNPIRNPGSAESREVEARGFHIARRGLRICLSR